VVLPGRSGYGEYLRQRWGTLCFGIWTAVIDRYSIDHYQRQDVQFRRIGELADHGSHRPGRRALYLGLSAAAFLEACCEFLAREFEVVHEIAIYFSGESSEG
jgi:hypothetical protein